MLAGIYEKQGKHAEAAELCSFYFISL